MKWIPAIDLKDGLPVHATGKDRRHYQPVNTALFPKLDLYSTICTLLYHYTFTDLYLADLNALMQTGNNTTTIQNAVKKFAEIKFWIDIGVRDRKAYRMLRQWGNNVVPIIPTETFTDIPFLKKLSRQDYILSLDFKDHQLLGNPLLLGKRTLWSEQVLILSLDAIRQGKPDLAVLDQVLMQNSQQDEQENSLNTQLILGGGIRNSDDIAALQEKGLSGVLLATALYQGTLLQ